MVANRLKPKRPKRRAKRPEPLSDVSPSAAAIARRYVQDFWGSCPDAIRDTASRGYLSALDLTVLRGWLNIPPFTGDARFAQNRQASAELERAIVDFCVRDVRGKR